MAARERLPFDRQRATINETRVAPQAWQRRQRELMNETTPAMPAARRDVAQAVANALEADDVELSGALLEVADRLGLLLAVKEVASGRYVHVNHRMAEQFGRTPDALIGVTDAELMEAAPAAAIRSAEQTALAHAAPTLSEHRVERGGRKREFSVIRSVLARGDGGPSKHVLAVWTELTAEHEREQQLKQALAQLEQQQVDAEAQRRETQDQALRDTATGLYQRMHFDDQLRREVDLSSREHREFSLVSIALDPFNDTVKALGSGARLRVLEALGRLLRGNTRAMDASCRLDEDRFAVLLSGVGLATAHSRMEGLRRQCATQIVVLDGRDLGFTVSMGVASFPHTAHTEDELLHAADLALDEARRRGGNHVALASIRFELGAA